VVNETAAQDRLWQISLEYTGITQAQA